MVRINLLNPKFLSDQHLIAEYNEILILVGQSQKFPKTKTEIPTEYCLGKGHITFFKNKFRYLEERFEEIKIEMKKRNFNPQKNFPKHDFPSTNWFPEEKDKKKIKKRILEKISLKPKWYRHYGENKNLKFWKEMIENAE